MEIERKFLIRELPNLSGIKPIFYERYYLKNAGDSVIRIQKKGDNYEYETKKTISDLEHVKEKHPITEEEFEKLREGNEKAGIIRESYQMSLEPGVTIKIYHGRFEGLLRAEVEFSTKEEAESYNPPEWMGKEITTSQLGADSRLLSLSDEEFLTLVNKS